MDRGRGETGLSSRSAILSERLDVVGEFLAPILRQFWMILLIVAVGSLATMAYTRMQAPNFEASAVVQIRPGVSTRVVEERLTSRANLLAMVVQHGLATDSGNGADRAAVLLRQAIAVHDLTSTAGGTLGFRPETTGIVVSVLLPDAELSARIANDLAQQILDEGNVGHFDENQTQLEFYRDEEQRLWQEISALRAELQQPHQTGSATSTQATLTDSRRLSLMQDQYDLVRQRLAGLELDVRLAARQVSGQFSLLQRATSTDAVTVLRNWMLAGVAGSLLLAVALAFVLERRYPALQRGPWDDLAPLKARIMQVYRLFDDPARPVWGVPRYLLITGVVVVMLVGMATLLG